jgi:hypothetical protein
MIIMPWGCTKNHNRKLFATASYQQLNLIFAGQAEAYQSGPPYRTPDEWDKTRILTLQLITTRQQLVVQKVL